MAEKFNYDFAGWATRAGVLCSDGRTIMKDAFKDCDGKIVPLVYNHRHDDVNAVLGHALLKSRDGSMYAYCKFNDTENGKTAKLQMQNGDYSSLSIYANQLKQVGRNVMHGVIREVSLVLAGANEGARIEDVNLEHAEDSEFDAEIFNACETIEHSDDYSPLELDLEEKTEDALKHADEEEKPKEEPKMAENESKERTVQDVVDSMTDEQRKVMYALIAAALEDAQSNNNNEEGTDVAKHNAFESNNANNEDVISHSEMNEILEEAKRDGKSAKATFLAHGITDIENFFPEVQAVNKTPELIARDMDWVAKVMNAVHKTPFSRIKSTAANITADAARAKGYVKGNQKVQEVITSLKRTTTPTTIYKLQKLDRDDVIDITDFDVVAWLKQEMQMMLKEELARQILIGDGRTGGDENPDVINPLNIRPIYGDDSIYTVKRILTPAANQTDAAFTKELIRDIIRSRKEYKGSGRPIFFTTEDVLTAMLLLEDTNGRVIYDTEEKLRTALRVSDIVTVECMENYKRVDDEETFDYQLLGLYVNLNDYNLGADKGGSATMFDDFDLDYNKMEYLIETRCSGALIKPYSAVTFEKKVAHQA